MNAISAEIIDCALQGHTQKLPDRGHHVERQESITCVIDGVTFNETFRVDLMVDGRVVVCYANDEGGNPPAGEQTVERRIAPQLAFASLR